MQKIWSRGYWLDDNDQIPAIVPFAGFVSLSEILEEWMKSNRIQNNTNRYAQPQY